MPNKDSLFLLEVLIDKIKLEKSPCFTEKDFKTCVTVECPAVPPIEICDDETGGCEAKGSNPFTKTFNIGKSCLFSMNDAGMMSAMNKFPVAVTVFMTLPCGCLPAKVVLGVATIDMTKEFIQARNKYLEDPNVVVPNRNQALKDCFRLSSPVDNTEQGTIDMFLRISCFGNLVVTSFQGAGGTLSTGQTNMNRSCDPVKQFQSREDPCVCGATLGIQGYRGGADQSCVLRDQRQYDADICEDPGDTCYCEGPKQPAVQPMSCRNVDPYCLHIPTGRSKAYEEIGTTLGGNELKIKVPAHAAIIKKISQTHCSIQQPYAKGKEGGPCEPPCGKNQISLALPSEPICCHGPQLADTQFTCTTEGCIQASKHGQLAMARGDTRTQEPGNRDTFVLKVAKTAIQGDRKCKLELELTAPKAGNKKLPKQKVNARIQSNMDCDYCDCCCRKVKKRKVKKFR